MLHAHSDVAFLPETHFFRNYLARPYSRWKYERGGPEVLRRALIEDEEYQRAEIPVDDLVFPFLKGDRPYDLNAVYTRLLRLYREREHVHVVGEKDPRLIDYLPQLKQAFPEAQILHIVRDPRDVLLSRLNADWSAGRPDWLHVLTSGAQLVRGHEQGRRCYGRQYMELCYEDLISNPERMLRKVTEHLDVTYSDQMLDFQRSAEELVDESERGWKEETTGPLLRDNTGKWRKGLSEWQVRLTERMCTKTFEWFDYEKKEPTGELDETQRAALRLTPVIGIGFRYLYALLCHFR
jgi:hypothetical protein